MCVCIGGIGGEGGRRGERRGGVGEGQSETMQSKSKRNKFFCLVKRF